MTKPKKRMDELNDPEVEAYTTQLEHELADIKELFAEYLDCTRVKAAGKGFLHDRCLACRFPHVTGRTCTCKCHKAKQTLGIQDKFVPGQ